MFSINSYNFPRLSDFASAQRYLQNTTPMRSGRNKGTVPLRADRCNPGIYYIFERQAVHPFSDEVQTEIVCQMYFTEIYRLFEDGTVFVSSYPSNSTHKVLSRLTGRAVNGNGVFFEADETMFPEYMQMFLPNHGHREKYGLPKTFDVPFDKAGIWLQHVGGRTHILRHGYMFGPGRHNIVKGAESLIRAVHKTCRVAATFAGVDPDRFSIDLPSNVPVERGPQHKVLINHMQRVLDKYDWKPGNDVTAELMSDMFMGNRHGPYKERMGWTNVLRKELKLNYLYSTKKTCFGKEAGENFYDCLERIALGID